jgi:hypothetical protein
MVWGFALRGSDGWMDSEVHDIFSLFVCSLF